MQDALRGLDNLTTRSSAIGNTMSALTCLLMFFSTTAYGQVVLDDFSASNESNYDFVPVFGAPSDGWTVTAGELRPSIDSSGGATWLWNQGGKLSAAGDSVSISLSLPAHANNGFDTSIGLFLAADAASIFLGHEISQTISRVDGVDFWKFVVDGFGDQEAPPSGPVQLTVQRTDEQTVDGFKYTTAFSGGGLPGPILGSFYDSSESLRFGPYAYKTTGTPAALDNFTFTAVPEPSMYAAVFGFLALAKTELEPEAGLFIWAKLIVGESIRIEPRMKRDVIASTLRENDGFLMAFAGGRSLCRRRIRRGKSTKN